MLVLGHVLAALPRATQKVLPPLLRLGAVMMLPSQTPSLLLPALLPSTPPLPPLSPPVERPLLQPLPAALPAALTRARASHAPGDDVHGRATAQPPSPLGW